ncbi:hypothetical protein FACS189464_1750 [Bacteroidia bacterium]|nr:hypothetical protein FACS189464_1750 [Bacteroidia bacterium]
MEHYHVIPVLINRPNIKESIMLPVDVRLVTGVMFFPCVEPASPPDGESMGTVGFSLDCERLNVVTNQKVFRKSPVFYKAAQSVQIAGGETFLDKGYNRKDFFECNDVIPANSFAVFKYQNRKMILAKSTTEAFNNDIENLKSLMDKPVSYKGQTFTFRTFRVDDDIITISTVNANFKLKQIEIYTEDLAEEIIRFVNPETELPYFEQSEDRPFVMKIILRHEDYEK